MKEFIPYLVNGFVEWCVDNNNKAHIVLNGADTDPAFSDLQRHVSQGHIVLNITPSAVKYFSITDEGISLECRIEGRVRHFQLPLTRLVGLQCFSIKANRVTHTVPLNVRPENLVNPQPEPEPPKPKKTRSHLSVVK